MYKDKKKGIIKFGVEYRLAGMMNSSSLSDVEAARVIVDLARVVEDLYEKVDRLTKENEQLKSKEKNGDEAER